MQAQNGRSGRLGCEEGKARVSCGLPWVAANVAVAIAVNVAVAVAVAEDSGALA